MSGRRKTLRTYPEEPAGVDDLEAAAKAHNACRAQGIPGSGIDYLICAIAMRREWASFSTDPDFRRYAKVLSFKLHLSPVTEA